MKKKIAIMTQPLGYNYGGIIQNYALQKVLNDMGHSSITINRRGENPHSKLKSVSSKYKTLFLRHILKQNKPTYLDTKKISINNRIFLEENLKLSPKMQSTTMLSEYFKKEKFTAVVVGSDQVWRPRYSPNILNFYLDFLRNETKIIKVAYAASFGTEKWEYTEDQTLNCNSLLQQFDGVSVREDSGVKLCAGHLNRTDAVNVLDPTLLLNAGEYSRIIRRPKKDIGLFTYVLDETSEKLKFIEKCARILNLDIHKNQAKLPSNNIQVDKIKDHVIPPIQGWLQGFRDAEFVITDSFHGTVFCIINRKPFFVLVNKSRGAARFESLLRQLGLEDRLIDDVEMFDVSNLNKDINYGFVTTKLEELKIQSLDFLNKYF